MKYDIDTNQSWEQLQWLDSPDDYTKYLIEIAINTFPECGYLLDSTYKTNWFDSNLYLSDLEKILSQKYLLVKVDLMKRSSEYLTDHVLHPNSITILAKRILNYIFLIESSQFISGKEVRIDIGNIASICLNKKIKKRTEKLFLFKTILYPPYDLFNCSTTAELANSYKTESARICARNLIALIGYRINISPNVFATKSHQSIEKPLQEVTSGNDSFTENPTRDKCRASHHPSSSESAPPVIVDGRCGEAFSVLRIGRKTRISFHRTLRIPEDGKNYPLPASLGTLPIHRVEDYAKKVPADWLEEGGFFLPLYQREALFLQFEGDSNRPMISKVCVGEINVITGQLYSENLSAHKQDYVVIPSQKWLDGINNGNGTVRQFVAMPLGQGYTVEAQVTDEEKYGGFQLVVYASVEGRFAEPPIPVSKKIDIVVAACRRRFELKFEASDTDTRTVIVFVRRGKLTRKDIMRYTGLSEEQINLVYEKFRYSFLQEVVETTINYFKGHSEIQLIQKQVLIRLESLGLREEIDPETVVPDDKPPGGETILRSSPAPQHYSEGVLYSSPSRQDPPESAKEMGIAAGGRLEQQIHPDVYGVDSWDENQRRAIKIHIINSEHYEEITGLPAPDSPVTAAHYEAAGIPWFSSYDESIKSLDGAAPFKRIRGVAEILKRRGIIDEEYSNGIKLELEPDQIRRIKTPTREEAADELRSKARSDVNAQNWKSAILKIDYLLDLGLEPTSHDYSLRSLCNYHSGRSMEAYVDAEAALTEDSFSVLALQIRARCRMNLGDYEGAKEDGVRLATILGSESTGNEIAAEASYYLGDYDEAVASAQMACEHDPQNSRAAEIANLAKSAPEI